MTNTVASATSKLDSVLELWYPKLQEWARSGQLRKAAKQALQLDGTPRRLKRIIEALSGGDFRDLPEIVLLPASSMPGAAGAYAISTGKIYINQDWLLQASDDDVISVLTHEYGHHLDSHLNLIDTAGEEGALLSRILEERGKRGAVYDETPLILEDSHGLIEINGYAIEVELASATYQIGGDLFTGGILQVLQTAADPEGGGFPYSLLLEEKRANQTEWRAVRQTTVNSDNYGASSLALTAINSGSLFRAKISYIDSAGNAEQFTTEEALVTSSTASYVFNGVFEPGETITLSLLSPDPNGGGELGNIRLSARNGRTTRLISLDTFSNSYSFQLTESNVGDIFSAEVSYIDGVGNNETVPVTQSPPVSTTSITYNISGSTIDSPLRPGNWSGVFYVLDTSLPLTASVNGEYTNVAEIDIDGIPSGPFTFVRSFISFDASGAGSPGRLYISSDEMSTLNNISPLTWNFIEGKTFQLNPNLVNSLGTWAANGSTSFNHTGGKISFGFFENGIVTLPPIVSSTGLDPVEGDTLIAASITEDPDVASIVSYAWFKDSVLLAGETLPSLATSPTGTGNYWVDISYVDSLGSTQVVTSPAIFVGQINNGEGFVSSISSSQPGSFIEGVTLSAGSLASLPEQLASIVSYTWLKNGVAIAGASSSSYLVPETGFGTYAVQITYNDEQGYLDTAISSPVEVAISNNGSAIYELQYLGSAVSQSLSIGVQVDAVIVTDDIDGGTSSVIYNWQRLDPLTNNWLDTGVQTPSYITSELDSGRDLRLLINHTDGQGFTENLTPLAFSVLDQVAPVFSSGATGQTITENSGQDQEAYNANALDDNTNVIYSLKPVDDHLSFRINSDTGRVLLVPNPDYESKPLYSFTVIAEDLFGNIAEQAVIVNILNLDENPPEFSAPSLAISIDENIGANQPILTAEAADDISPVSYAIGAFGDSTLFNIEPTTGIVRLLVNPDFEDINSYSFSVVATDSSGNSAEQIISLSVNDLDEIAPEFVSGTIAMPIDENSGSNLTIYTAQANDETSAVSYSIKQEPGSDSFLIDATTGNVTLIPNPDFESQDLYQFTVVAKDAAGNSSELQVSLSINDVNEVAPIFTSGVTATPIDENSGPNQIIYTAQATDDSSAVTYSLKAGLNRDSFSIDATTGNVTLITDPDFESQNLYQFTVVATDASGNAAEQTVTLNINDLNEAPPPASEAITEPTYVSLIKTIFDISVNGGSEEFFYYIHPGGDLVDIGFDDLGNALPSKQSISSAPYVQYIEALIEYIDSIIDLDLTRTFVLDESYLDFYFTQYNGDNSFGTTYSYEAAYVEVDIEVTGFMEEDLNTTAHETGHSFGLEHPQGDGFNPNYTMDDTVMSYNIGSQGLISILQQADIDALLSIWGAENDPPQTDSGTNPNNGNTGNNSGTSSGSPSSGSPSVGGSGGSGGTGGNVTLTQEPSNPQPEPTAPSAGRRIFASNPADPVIGTDGDDQLVPKSPGSYFMTGNRGADKFVFAVAESRTIDNADYITDYSLKEGDRVVLYDQVFGLGSLKFKVAKNKKKVKKLYNKKTNLIYDQSKSQLIVDLNGRGKGLAGGGVIAVFTNEAKLTKTSFELIEGVPPSEMPG
jgi:hypothetical protein